MEKDNEEEQVWKYVHKRNTSQRSLLSYMRIYIPSASRTFLFMVVAEKPGFFRITRFSKIWSFHHVR